MNIFRTMIVPADYAALARDIVNLIDPVHNSGMFTTGLASVNSPTMITHYVSTGWMSGAFVDSSPISEWKFDDNKWVRITHNPGNPAAIIESISVFDSGIAIADVTKLFEAMDSTTDDPWVVLARLGLVLASEPDP